MKKFADFLLNESSSFSQKQVEEFLRAIIDDNSDFQWQTTDRDFEEGFEYGGGHFAECIKKAEKAAKDNFLDVVGAVSLHDAQLGEDIILQYDPKKKKWSLMTR